MHAPKNRAAYLFSINKDRKEKELKICFSQKSQNCQKKNLELNDLEFNRNLKSIFIVLYIR